MNTLQKERLARNIERDQEGMLRWANTWPESYEADFIFRYVKAKQERESKVDMREVAKVLKVLGMIK